MTGIPKSLKNAFDRQKIISSDLSPRFGFHDFWSKYVELYITGMMILWRIPKEIVKIQGPCQQLNPLFVMCVLRCSQVRKLCEFTSKCMMKTLDVTSARNYSPTSTSWKVTNWHTHKRRKSVSNVFSLSLAWNLTSKELTVNLVPNYRPAQTVELRSRKLGIMKRFVKWPQKKKPPTEKTWKSSVKSAPRSWQTNISCPDMFHLLTAKRCSISACFVITKITAETTWKPTWKITTVKPSEIKIRLFVAIS